MQVSNTKSPQTEVVVGSYSANTCGRCNMFYRDYKQLLEHLYWRHGTESRLCTECGLKQWGYAAHVCHILPIFIDLLDDNNELCFCGREEHDAPMIGCDGPHCAIQWFHFSCVGVVRPPDGDWYCPTCRQFKDKLSDREQT